MWRAFLAALLLLRGFAPASASPNLSTEGTHFVDASGRVVILRGVNVAADFKIPPFVHPAKLDPLPGWGVNAIRLIFNWEAYEPQPGAYDDGYLKKMDAIVDEAERLHIYVVLDLHQDAYSRYLSPGCGAGFPAWTVPEAYRAPARASADCSPLWAVRMALTPGMHKSYQSLYDAGPTREGYVRLWSRLAAHFKSHPAVVGYDLINEPWGDEATSVAPLYRDAAAAIHKADASAIVFIESDAFPVSFGWADTQLPPPDYKPVAYAPHFYDPLVLVSNHWSPWLKRFEARGIRKLIDTARSWNTPVFIGEMGVTGATRDPAPFMEFQYAQMAARFASMAQYSYSPDWTARGKDGWNGEDSSIVDEQGRLKAFFPLVPVAQVIAGRPIEQRLGRDMTGKLELDLRWEDSGKGLATEVYAPGPASRWLIRSKGSKVRCRMDPARPMVVCRAGAPGEKAIELAEAP